MKAPAPARVDGHAEHVVGGFLELETASTGVDGLSASPPDGRSRGSPPGSGSRAASASTWKLMQSAPAPAKSAICWAGRRSSGERRGPAGVVDLVGDRGRDQRPDRDRGTKCPSMTSTWMTARRPPSPPPPGPRGGRSRRRGSRRHSPPENAPAQRPPARTRCSITGRHRVPAFVGRAARVEVIRTIVWCSPQFGTGRDELVALEAVDAAVAARELGGAQPRLPPAGADRPGSACASAVIAPGSGGCPRRSRAMKKPSVPSRSGRACRKRPSRRDRSLGCSADRGRRRRRPQYSDEQARDHGSRSRRRRSCRSSRPGSRRGAAPPPRRRDPRSEARPAARHTGRLAPARVGARGERAEIGARGDPRGRDRNRAEVGLRPSATSTRAHSAPGPPERLRSSSARPASISTATISPSPRIRPRSRSS